jgi:hypothetical protein
VAITKDPRIDPDSQIGAKRFSWREGLGLVGLLATVTGTIAVFTTKNDAGSAALVFSGVACIALAALWDRLKSVEAGGVKLEIIEVAQQRLAAAKEAEARGERTEAARLRAEAEDLLARVNPLAAEYEAVRDQLPPGKRRTAALERIVERLRREARIAREQGSPFDAGAVKERFGSGRLGDRVAALAFMQGDEAVVDPAIVLGVLAAPLSPFEETQAFRVAATMSRSQSLRESLGRELLSAAERALEDGHLDKSASRRENAQAIIQALAPKYGRRQ